MTAARRDIRSTEASVSGRVAIESSVTVAEVAEALAVSTDAVRREIRRGAIVAEKVFGRVRIRESELERYRAEHRIGERSSGQAPSRTMAPRRAVRGSLAALRAIEEEASG